MLAYFPIARSISCCSIILLRPLYCPRPTSYGCRRKFNTDWVTKYPWLVYSSTVDGVYCGPCALLCQSRADKSLFVNTPFSNWVKLSSALANHAKLKYHSKCLQDSDTLKETVDNPNARLDVMVNIALQERLRTNQHVLKEIVRAVLFSTKQGLPLRGHREHIITEPAFSNPGNFLALLKYQAITDPVLNKHLEQPEARNATYLSPRSQNEVIQVIGHDIILANILNEVKMSKFYAVLADEVSSHNVEHLAVCLRFVSMSGEIREVFVCFLYYM